MKFYEKDVIAGLGAKVNLADSDMYSKGRGKMSPSVGFVLLSTHKKDPGHCSILDEN